MKYKIVISEIKEKEFAETEYQITGKDKNGENTYDYVKTGIIGTNIIEEKIYSQFLDTLDIGELAVFLNKKQ